MSKPFNIHDWQDKQKQLSETNNQVVAKGDGIEITKDEMDKLHRDGRVRLKDGSLLVFPSKPLKLKEDLQIDNLFGEYVAQWSQGNYDYDFADLKSGSVKGSLVDDFTLGPDEYDDDDYVRDYKMMRDYLLKNRSYKLSQDEQEGLSQFPVQFSLEDDGETIKADIYYSPEYLAMVDADLDEASATGTGASFNAGSGEGYMSPNAFGDDKKKKMKAYKSIGYKKV
tara:strand:+ start:68 stop:742 length:675 start_codon:yes stop_codon:yes gene_type:complete